MGKLIDKGMPTKHAYAILGFVAYLLLFLASLVMFVGILNYSVNRIEVLVMFLVFTFGWMHGAYRYLKYKDFDEAFYWFGQAN